MTCNDIRMHLMDYAWQRLSAAEAGAVERHLAGCSSCRAVLEEERSLGEALAAVPTAAPRHDLWQSVRARQMALDLPTQAKGQAAPSTRLIAPVIAERVRASRAWQRWTVAITSGVAVMALMLMPSQPNRTPGQGAIVLAQTLDTARQVAQQSDDPLGEMSDSTLDVLSDAAFDAGGGAGEDTPS